MTFVVVSSPTFSIRLHYLNAVVPDRDQIDSISIFFYSNYSPSLISMLEENQPEEQIAYASN